MPHSNQITQEARECIQTCMDCHVACTETAMHCLGMGGLHASRRHIGLLLDCAQMCHSNAGFILRWTQQETEDGSWQQLHKEATSGQSDREAGRHLEASRLCAEICEQCADDCERIAESDQTMKNCVEVCRRCAAACLKMSGPTRIPKAA